MLHAFAKKRKRDQITTSNQPKSPFLRLPAEIRNLIYSHALDHASVYRESTGFAISRPLRRDDIGLPRTCRQINSETRSFLETYTSLSLTGYEIFAESHNLGANLERRGRSFDNVRELVLSPQQVTCLGNWSIFFRTYPEQDLGAHCRKLRSIFPSVKRLVIFSTLEDHVADFIRNCFGERDLEIVHRTNSARAAKADPQMRAQGFQDFYA